MTQLFYSGLTSLGYKRETNEDFMMVCDVAEGITLGVIADGAGSRGTSFQPASLCAIEIRNTMRGLLRDHREAVEAYPETFLERAVLAAGRMLAAFKTANEEVYNGYAASVSCCLFFADGRMTFAHTGNTRIHMLRVKQENLSIRQLTVDQTEGQRLVNIGEMTVPEYHLSRERLIITGGLGVVEEPMVQTYTIPLKDNDIILMTTDGIHYAIRPDVMAEIVRRSEGVDEAVKVLIDAAEQQEYNDNAAAIVFWNKTQGG